jgi:hypothetical protein
MSDNWDCYLQGVGTVAPSNADIGMMKTRLDKMSAALSGVKDLCERAERLNERADRIERRRRDEAGDVVQGDPAAAEPLAARS